MKRMYGRAGTPTTAQVNAFPLSWRGQTCVSHYDAITPKFTHPAGKQIVLGAEKGTELMQRLQRTSEAGIFPKLAAFDGKKNLYSFERLEILGNSERFQVPWDSGGHGRIAEIRITKLKEVNLDLLHGLIAGTELGNPGAIGPGTDVSTSLHMLQVFLQAAPRMSPGTLHKGKNVYVKSQSHRQNREVGPLELRVGLFQSVRPTIERLIVNVDVTVGVVLREQPLTGTLLDFFNTRDVWFLNRLERKDLEKLAQFIRRVKVKIQLPGQYSGSRTKARPIRGIVPNVGERRFDRDGFQVTVAEHFKKVHAVTIQPGSLGVLIGQHELFPISVCHVPEQLYKPKLQPEYVREVLSFVPRNPQERLQCIKAGWQNLEYDSSEFLYGARINIDQQPLTIHGRLLPSPRVLYGPKERPTEAVMNNRGTWDVKQKRFFDPAKIPFMLVINYATSGPQPPPLIQKFVHRLSRVMIDRGMSFGRPYMIFNKNPATSVATTIDELIGKYDRKKVFVLVLLQEQAGELYTQVKRAGDIIVGVPTQCVRWSKKLAGDVDRMDCGAYLNNLVLKINVRLGGINHVPKSMGMDLLRKNGVAMVIGADVSHPAPGSTGPSFASVVASMDDQYSCYVAQMQVQHSRLEIIQQLCEMVKNALEKFQKRNFPDGRGKLERIYLFRDGVSEGEFEIVRQAELRPLKNMLNEYYRGQPPAITFIVVGKRHHIRFFPGPDADRSRNCQSGFVVDTDIVHPVYSDFYLQSQAGLKGTSIPSHYTILEDKNFGGDPDALQSIAYALCHCYQRSTRSVKIPAPVYYADLVCRRAKIHFDDHVSMGWDGMSVSSGGTSDQTAQFASHFDSVCDPMDKLMYFV